MNFRVNGQLPERLFVSRLGVIQFIYHESADGRQADTRDRNFNSLSQRQG